MSLQGILYVPNGPMLVDPSLDGKDSSRAALRERGRKFPDSLEAVFVVTPHFYTRGGVAVVSTEKMKQIFDFSGFPEEFYNIKYEPPGDPELARELVLLGLGRAVPMVETGQWGLDHGAWTPLVHLLPEANVPVIPISVMEGADPFHYEELGKAMAELAERRNIALVATGSLIHRLDLFQIHGREVPEDASRYLDTVITSLKESDWERVWNIPGKYYRAAAPEGGLLPLRTLAGATGSKFTARVLSNEIMFNSVSMTAIDFS